MRKETEIIIEKGFKHPKQLIFRCTRETFTFCCLLSTSGLRILHFPLQGEKIESRKRRVSGGRISTSGLQSQTFLSTSKRGGVRDDNGPPKSQVDTLSVGDRNHDRRNKDPRRREERRREETESVGEGTRSEYLSP